MFFSKKNIPGYSEGKRNFKLKIEDKFKKDAPKDKLHIWPDGYRRFSALEKSEDPFFVKPQKFNYKIVIFSILVVLLLWFIGLRTIEKKKMAAMPEEKSVMVLIAPSDDTNK